MRSASALITLVPGKGKPIRVEVPHVQSYQIRQDLDNDSDTFSLDFGDKVKLPGLLDRDTEVHVALFATNLKGVRRQIFNGLADVPQLTDDHVYGIQGRDLPSGILLDTDAQPGRWRKVKPQSFVHDRGKKLGVTSVQIAKMKEIPVLFTDGTEKEWGFWYRFVRDAGMYMWATNNGGLVIDHLAYSTSKISYKFGTPPQGAANRDEWIGIAGFTLSSNKQGRPYQTFVYAEDAKKGTVIIGKSRDPRIQNWTRKPILTIADNTFKTQAKADDAAKLEQYESLVGGQEHTLVVRDVGMDIERNTMCQVNLPAYDFRGTFFIIGAERTASEDGFVQVIRLRERQYALSKRVPTAPTIDPAESDITNKPVGNLSGALANEGVPYADSFVRAAREFGEQNGWDFSVYLGVLMSIASHESSFQNVREIGGGIPKTEWYPRSRGSAGLDANDRVRNDPGGRDSNERDNDTGTLTYEKLFANKAGNPLNPFSREAGVGIMQLTTPDFKVWADEYGWNDQPRHDEYEGGRWNPDSNIRAGARVLLEKLKAVGANPTQSETIWNGVRAYNGSGAAAERYMQEIKALYNEFYSKALAASSDTQKVISGSAMRRFNLPGHGVVELPAGTPPEVSKAITWAVARIGNPYLWAGWGQLVEDGPHKGEEQYDCSSFVTGAYTKTTASLSRVLDGPSEGHHGADTFTIFGSSHFKSVSRDALKPGDLVFFFDVDHVGMYIDDGLFIHDPHSHDFVKITGISEAGYREGFSGARRIVSWGPTE